MCLKVEFHPLAIPSFSAMMSEVSCAILLSLLNVLIVPFGPNWGMLIVKRGALLVHTSREMGLAARRGLRPRRAWS